jgi:hypothetical protein
MLSSSKIFPGLINCMGVNCKKKIKSALAADDDDDDDDDDNNNNNNNNK